MLIIGDVHGKISQLGKIYQQKKPKSSIILGDLGFKKEHDWFLNNVYGNSLTAKRFGYSGSHKVLFGNHDDYAYLHCPHSLSDFGSINNEIGFVRGAESIDKVKRTIGYDYWEEEEINQKEEDTLLSWYEKLRPRIMLSHDAPIIANKEMFDIENRSFTAHLLQKMWEIHQPEFWIFGHHHKSITMHISSTAFICLGELETLEILMEPKEIDTGLKHPFTTRELVHGYVEIKYFGYDVGYVSPTGNGKFIATWDRIGVPSANDCHLFSGKQEAIDYTINKLTENFTAAFVQ